MVPRNRPFIDWQAGRSLTEFPFSSEGSDNPNAANHATFVTMPRISVIIPARNEARNLPFVLPEIPTWVQEVILVDGHSSDETVAEACRLLPDLRVVHQEHRGKGDALRLGFETANGDIIVVLDADGSTDPKAIPAFVTALLSGADYAKGSRFLKAGGTDDMGWLRQFGNAVFVLLVRLFFRTRYTDLCFGYNAFWKDILPQLTLRSDGFEIETEMNIQVARANLWVIEVPCFEAKRIFGESNLRTFQDGWRVFRTIIHQFSQAFRLAIRSRLGYDSRQARV